MTEGSMHPFCECGADHCWCHVPQLLDRYIREVHEDWRKEAMTKPIDEYNEAMLAAGLAILSMTQRVVGRAVPGWVEGEPEFVRTTFLALIVECTELLQHFNWKQWKFPRDPDTGAMAEEFADILAFTGYLVLWMVEMGVTPQQLAEAYRTKTELNIKRLRGEVSGYGLPREQPGDHA